MPENFGYAELVERLDRKWCNGSTPAMETLVRSQQIIFFYLFQFKEGLWKRSFY